MPCCCYGNCCYDNNYIYTGMPHAKYKHLMYIKFIISGGRGVAANTVRCSSMTPVELLIIVDVEVYSGLS